MTSKLKSGLLSLLSFSMIAASFGCGSSNGELDFDRPTGSSGIASGDIDADMLVVSAVDGEVEARVVLAESRFFGSDIVLSAGESLVAEFDGDQQTLVRDPAELDDPAYFTVFSGGATSGNVAFNFNRDDASIVMGAIGVLRPAFSPTSPVTGQLYRFNEMLPLNWAPGEPAALMLARIRIACTTTAGPERVVTRTVQVTDDGVDAFDLSTSPLATDPEINQTIDCDLTTTYERRTESDISPPYANFTSTLSATQAREVTGVIVRF